MHLLVFPTLGPRAPGQLTAPVERSGSNHFHRSKLRLNNFALVRLPRFHCSQILKMSGTAKRTFSKTLIQMIRPCKKSSIRPVQKDCWVGYPCLCSNSSSWGGDEQLASLAFGHHEYSFVPESASYVQKACQALALGDCL